MKDKLRIARGIHRDSPARIHNAARTLEVWERDDVLELVECVVAALNGDEAKRILECCFSRIAVLAEVDRRVASTLDTTVERWLAGIKSNRLSTGTV